MLKYEGFIFESKCQSWEKLYELKEFDNLMDSLSDYLEKEYSKGIDRFTEKVINLLKRFRNNIRIITTVVSLLTTMYLSSDVVKSMMHKANVPTGIQTSAIDSLNKTKSKKKNEIGKFLYKLSHRESTNDATIINQYGYIGKYQMGPDALKDIGIYDEINLESFKKDPSIWPSKQQDKDMIKLLKKNKEYLGDYFNKYDGKKIGNIVITKSGLLAGSHLVGASNVKKFLDSNGSYIPKDGNGVPVTEYIMKFGGLNIKI